MSTAKIERITFQYSDVCNMRCSYCYCPFEKKKVEPELCFSILERCAQLGAKVITFGGGDPFMYGSFRELLPWADAQGFECHVDTNGISLREKDYQLISDHVSLLSLPLDGGDDLVHARMRSMAGHFNVVLNHLGKMKGVSCTLKINTVVASMNQDSMPRLADLLRNYPVDIWSLFHFWPLGMAFKNQHDFNLPDGEYKRLADELRGMNLPFRIESGTFSERKGHHFFVMHTGMVYTHDKNDHSQYRYLGSIFDDQVIEEWRRSASPSRHPAIHPNSIQRYKSISE